MSDNTNNEELLLDKDKLLLFFHVGVKNTPYEIVANNLVNMQNALNTSFDNSVKAMIIPNKDNNIVKIDHVYTQTISNEDDKNRLVDIINKLEEATNKFYDTQIHK